jgi:hypothetical protein
MSERMKWRITVGDHTLNEDEATVDHVLAVVDLTGLDEWDVIDPGASPKILLAWAAVVLALGESTDIAAATTFLKSRPAGDLIQCYRRMPLAVPDAAGSAAA